MLREQEGVVDFEAEILDGRLDPGVVEHGLDEAQIAGVCTHFTAREQE